MLFGLIPGEALIRDIDSCLHTVNMVVTKNTALCCLHLWIKLHLLTEAPTSGPTVTAATTATNTTTVTIATTTPTPSGANPTEGIYIANHTKIFGNFLS